MFFLPPAGIFAGRQAPDPAGYFIFFLGYLPLSTNGGTNSKRLGSPNDHLYEMVVAGEQLLNNFSKLVFKLIFQ